MEYNKRLAVNFAIEQLVSGEAGEQWRDNARTIIRACQEIPLSGTRVEFSKPNKESDAFTGHTDEMGDVQVESGDKTERRVYTFGDRVERIGHYKVRRFRRKISIETFWKADQTTSSMTESPDYYELFYSKGLEPKRFGILDWKIVFDHFAVMITRPWLEVMYGQPEKWNWRFGVTIGYVE
jgi:hypothetical protein